MYRRFFAEAAGRSIDDGPPGASSRQPILARNMREWSASQWADWWVQLGRYGGALDVDENGWMPLHHAIQAMVHWEWAYKVVIGLIRRMDTEGLRTKTTGGRPAGWSALHMCANGSDVGHDRAHMVTLLLEGKAEVDARDEKGRTPFHLAAGTGMVDVAEALMRGGADVFLKDPEGRNAMDRARGSSSQMKRRPHTMHCTVQYCIVFYYYTSLHCVSSFLRVPSLSCFVLCCVSFLPSFPWTCVVRCQLEL